MRVTSGGLQVIEDGLRKLVRGGMVEEARGVCVGELEGFGRAVINHELCLIALEKEGKSDGK